MTKAFNTLFAFVTLSSLGFASPARSADLSECQAITDRDARYACYDRAEASAPTAPASTSGSPGRTAGGLPILRGVFNRGDKDDAASTPAQASTPVPEQSEVDSFGLPQARAASVVERENGEKELIAEVASLDQRGYNMWLITLGNGQQWAQVENKRYRLEEGDSVRIYPSGWGDDYRLTVERLSSFIQVRRVK